MEQMKFVFISHSNKSPDAEICERLYAYLTKKGFCCWMDREDMHHGSWKDQIIEKVVDATALILVESENSRTSDQVKIEIDRMKEVDEITHTKRPIIPFVLDSNSLNKETIKLMGSAFHNVGVGSLQSVFLEKYGSEEEAFERLIFLLQPLGITQLKNNSAHFNSDENDDKVLKKYTGHDAFVEIPPYIREICDNAFIGNNELVSVVIPDSVKKIGKRAFFGCSALSQVSGMNGVEDIEASAFSGSGVAPKERTGYVINGILFGDVVGKDGKLPAAAVISQNAFFGCSAEELEFEEGLEVIGDGAFRGSYKLQRVTFPASLKVIGENAFSRCNKLQEVIFKGTAPHNAREIFKTAKITEEK